MSVAVDATIVDGGDAKRQKRGGGSQISESKKKELHPTIPSSLIVSFKNQEGDDRGTPSVEVPVGSTAKQLELLINTLLAKEEKLPYAFYINNMEVVTSVQDTLALLSESGAAQSYEETLSITYQPLSVFRVRPVTRCVETMPGHSDAVLHVSYSPDGKRLASGGGDKAVRFWNTITHMPQHTCLGHRDHVLCTIWSPDGESFVSADRSGEIRVWDPPTGKPKGQPLRGHRKWVTALSFEPLHLDPTCSRLASSSKDHTVKIWNLRTGQCETTISGHTDSVECVKWGGTGLVYSCSRDRTIKVWAVDGSGRSQHKLVRTLTGHAHRVNSLALNCDYVLRTGAFQLGESVAVGGAGKGSLKKAERFLKGSGGEGEGAEGGATDQWMVESGKKGGRSGSSSSSSSSNSSSSSSSDGGGTDGGGEEDEQAAEAVADDVEDGEKDRTKTRSVGSKDGATGSGKGNGKGSGSSSSIGSGISCSQPKHDLATLQKRAQERYDAVVGGAGETLVSGSDDFTLFLWSPTQDKKPVIRLTGHQQAVNHIAFSPDGRFFASASFDKKVKLWCGKTGRFLATLSGHVGSVYQVAWSADSNYLVSASKDSTVKLWSVKDPKKALFTLPGHEDEVYAVDWSPNGSQVASGSKDRTIKIWHH